jgi:RHH-type proline utilization regulon transcriptional repressor/proline dehydrogenase/delta 1-pyrroline-5-carboxylate dehydrogenase
LGVIERGKKEARTAYAGDVGGLSARGLHRPHVFADVDPASFMAQEEFFGPILAAIRYRDLSHALEIANEVPYALTGGLYSRSPAHIARAEAWFRVW